MRDITAVHLERIRLKITELQRLRGLDLDHGGDLNQAAKYHNQIDILIWVINLMESL